MDIFEATLELKKYKYDNNNQLININDKIELSGFSPLPVLCYYNKIKDIKDYEDFTISQKHNYIFEPDIFHYRRKLKEIDFIDINELSPDMVNTKEYWNFLHKEFQYCDVSSYYKVNDLNSYFAVKGAHYDGFIKKIGIEKFKHKKILEIGAGYGYLNKTLTEHNMNYTYFYADIVKRFEHNNFIDINGYDLNNITDKFDIIIMCDVIQHLGTNILKQYLNNIKSLLSDSGKLYIITEMRSLENFNFFFFGQSYENLGYEKLDEYLCDIGFDVKYEYYSIAEFQRSYIIKIEHKCL